MSSAQTLFGKAVANLRSAQLIYENSDGDEDQLNIAGYLLQQAVELAMKYLIEQNGIEFPKTHDIDQLIRMANANDVDLLVSEYLDDHAETLSLWEAKSRSILGYAIEARKVERMLEEVDQYLERIAAAENA